MKTLELSIVDMIKKLRLNGYSYKEIAKKFDISSSTTYKYCHKVILNQNGKMRLLNKKEINKNNFISNFATAREIIYPQRITDEFVRILGHCLFDGCVSDDQITYTNASKKLVNEFIRDMKFVFGVIPAKIETRKYMTPYYVVHYNYKKINDYLLKISSSFSTSKNCSSKTINYVYKLDKHKISEFLKTFWDDEGCIKSCKDITAKTKSKIVAYALRCLHKKIGIIVNIYWDSKNDAYEIYLVKNKNNLNIFRKLVGFPHGVVCKGKFKGLYKSEVFKILFPV